MGRNKVNQLTDLFLRIATSKYFPSVHHQEKITSIFAERKASLASERKKRYLQLQKELVKKTPS